MARRVRESFIGPGFRMEFAYAARLSEYDILVFRPALKVVAILGNDIRERFRKQKVNARGKVIKWGHYDTGGMWDSMMASALSGKRGDRAKVGFPGQSENSRGQRLRNSAKAWYVSQLDESSIMELTDSEIAKAVDLVADMLGESLTLEFGLASGGQSIIKARQG